MLAFLFVPPPRVPPAVYYAVSNVLQPVIHAPHSHPHSCREHSLKRLLVRIQPDGDFAENISWWGFCREHNTIRLLLTNCSSRRDNAYSFCVISSRLQDVLNGLVRDTVWCSHPVPLMPPSILLTEIFLYGNVTVRKTAIAPCIMLGQQQTIGNQFLLDTIGANLSRLLHVRCR